MRQMLAVGDFIFSVYQNTAFEQLVRTSHGGFSTLDRGGQQPASQQTGPALETIQLSGEILGNTGGDALDRLREIQAARQPQPVVEGDGTVLGLWKVQQIVETKSKLIDDGTALKTKFSVSLEQYV